MGARFGGQLVLGADHEVAAPHLDHVDLDAIEVAEPLAGEDLVGAADGPAPAHEVQDAVDVGQHGIDLMGDEDHGRPGLAATLVDEPGHRALACQVEGEERFVAQQHAGSAQQRLRDAQPLLLATREQTDGGVGVAHGVNRLERGVDPAPRHAVVEGQTPAVPVEAEAHQVASPDGQGPIEGLLLGHVAQLVVARGAARRR